MKYTDQYFYKKLEIDEIIGQLVSLAVLPVTKNYFNNIFPLVTKKEIELELAKVKEALDICYRYERAPIYLSLDYEELLNIVVKGGVLTGVELFETVRLFSTIRANERLLTTLKKEQIKCKYYSEYVDNLYIDVAIEKELRKSLDDTGYILDDATSTLKKIRSRLKGIDDRIKNKLQEIIATKASYLADSIVVIRDDRYCLAIKAEYKNSFNGILHDVSSSNLTAYMEPAVIAEMSNEKDRLRNEEKEEMERILRNLSQMIANEEYNLRANYLNIVELDKIFAKAMLGKSYDGSAPKVNTDGFLSLKNARHPLLKVDKVIPNNIEFGKDYLGIVITGPNTGGKSVLLKTVGLLSLMVKFGLLIPADEESDVMVYDHIFCDIGDDQSIQENLSTFSSHMRKMIAIVNQVTPNSLALFDEIGSGTDPVEGSAIAISVLKYFINKNVRFITTTHYADLKTFAYTSKEIVNASMAFNEDTMMPTYHLVIGKSGSSNALSIAQNLGLKKDIIACAKEILTNNNDQSRILIQKIEAKSNYLDNLEKSLKDELSKTLALQNDYENKMSLLEKEKNKIIVNANNKANEIIEEASKKAFELLEEVKKLQNKNLKLHEIIDVQSQINDLNNSKFINKQTKKKQIVNNPKIGMRVYLIDYQQYGTISRIRKDKSVDVSIGNISVNVLKEDLELVTDVEKEVVNNVVIERNNVQSGRVSLSLDLRGKRFTDAKDLLDKYIDDLLLSNIKSATIIHGFGTGTIRELVQDFCRKNKYIDSYRYGVQGEGGLGVTVITLK